ncbi:MAG: cytochrome c-type biogenesis protein CcmH [Alphaproteobacteria bacterium]|nr:cytochrome c-type biogenesis protein CcmH [Alphaproteobacteria bacterium]
MIHAAVLALALLWSAPAFAVEPGEVLADPALEARARDISRELRCLVCQNQSIDDSNADLARDLRVLVRERLKAGDSDREVIRFVVARYGDFVLLDPPFQPSTLLLWAGPALVLLGGAAGIAVWFRRRTRNADEPAPLSADERRRLEALTADSGGDKAGGA